METLENVMPTFRVSSFDGKHSSFSASREYDTVNIFRRESVNSLSLRCRGLTVCQCQRDKEKKKGGIRQTKASDQSSDIKCSFLLLFSQKAKCQTISTRCTLKYIFTLAKKSMNFVNRIYRARYHPCPVQTILSLRGTSAVRQK